MRSAEEPSANATRSPSAQPRASSAPAARRWRCSASAACSSSTVAASPGTGAAYARPVPPLGGDGQRARRRRIRPRRRRRGGAGARPARAGASRRGADRCRHLDGLGHPRLPRPAGRVDQGSRGREDGDAAGLRLRPGTAPALVAEPAHLTDVGLGAQRRPPRPGRTRAERSPRHAGDAEHRRAPPQGRDGPGAHHRDPRHGARGRLPGVRRPPGGRARPRPGARRRGRPRLHVVRGDPQVRHHQLRPEPGGRRPLPRRGRRRPRAT